MLCDLYERVKSWEGPGAGMAALIARSKFGATHIDMTDKLFGEMRRLVNLDEKAVEEELRKLGVTLDLVEPAAVGAKSKKPTKRKSPAGAGRGGVQKMGETRPWSRFPRGAAWYPDEVVARQEGEVDKWAARRRGRGTPKLHAHPPRRTHTPTDDDVPHPALAPRRRRRPAAKYRPKSQRLVGRRGLPRPPSATGLLNLTYAPSARRVWYRRVAPET